MAGFGVIKLGHIVRFDDRWGMEQVGVVTGCRDDELTGTFGWHVWVPLNCRSYSVYPDKITVIAGVTSRQRLQNLRDAENSTRAHYITYTIWAERLENTDYRFYGKSIDAVAQEVRQWNGDR